MNRPGRGDCDGIEGDDVFSFHGEGTDDADRLH